MLNQVVGTKRMTESVDDFITPEMRELTDALKGIRLSVKSAISLEQTEADYVLDLDVQSSHLNSSPLVAATSSNFTVRLFSKETLASHGIISGHKNTITGVRFSRENKDLLYSSSQDDSVRCWDLRSPNKAVQCFKGYTEAESLFTTFDLSCNERVICAGSEVNKDGDAYLTFWDVRQASQMGCYSESHQDDITQVRFHPSQPDTLASGSTDGLVCVYDISQSSEDDALLTTLNSCSSVQKIGWCGGSAEDIYCVTHIDTFHIWNGLEGDNLLELTDIKDRTQKLCEMDYIVDCVVRGNASDSSKPILLTGTHSGALQLLEVDKGGDEVKVKQVCRLTDGHTATVRCLHWDDQSESLITGAEDSLLCLWSATCVSNQPSTNRHKKMRAKLKTTKSKKGRPY